MKTQWVLEARLFEKCAHDTQMLLDLTKSHSILHDHPIG